MALGAESGRFAIDFLDGGRGMHDAAGIGAVIEAAQVPELVEDLLHQAVRGELECGGFEAFQPGRADDRPGATQGGFAKDEGAPRCTQVSIGEGDRPVVEWLGIRSRQLDHLVDDGIRADLPGGSKDVGGDREVGTDRHRSAEDPAEFADGRIDEGGFWRCPSDEHHPDGQRRAYSWIPYRTSFR
jgi:hypothetical protein